MPKWLSPKRRQKRVKNLTSEWNQKQQHFFPHASRSLLCIQFVAVAFWSEEEVSWRRGPPDLFLPRPGSAPVRIWPKNNNTCKGPWVLHPYQVSSKSIKRFWRRSWKCRSLRTDDDGRTDDRRTDDGQRAMTIALLSLWLRWAKKHDCRICEISLKSKQEAQWTISSTV